MACGNRPYLMFDHSEGKRDHLKRATIVLSLLAIAAIIGGCMQSNGHRWTPLQLAVMPEAQLTPASWDVYGVSANALGNANHDMIGIGAGFETTAHRTDGVHVGAWGLRSWSASGLQVSGLGGSAFGEMNGLQLAGLFNGVPPMGWEDASLADAQEENAGRGVLRGAQVAGVFNRTQRTNGLQVAGLFNKAEKRMSGLQVSALYNKSRRLAGVQIGLLNFHEGGWLPFFPLLNIGFGGVEEEPAGKVGAAQ